MRKEFYKRSPNGLWVRARRIDGKAVFEWQVRHRFSGTGVEFLDDLGEVERVEDVRTADLSEIWREFGSVDMDLWGASDLCVSGIENVQFGVMRHVVSLVVGGFGLSPEDVVECFLDPDKMGFVFECSYRIDEPVGVFEGLGGEAIDVFGGSWPVGYEISVKSSDPVSGTLSSNEEASDFLSFLLPIV